MNSPRNKRSKHFTTPSGDFDSNSLGDHENPSVQRPLKFDDSDSDSGSSRQQNPPSLTLTSKDSDATVQYSQSLTDDYDRKDFVSSDDENDDGEDREQLRTPGPKAKAVEISDNSSDDDDTETQKRPWKRSPVAGANKGKYRMRQTTLDDFNKKNTERQLAGQDSTKVMRSRFKYSDLDTAAYRDGYPGQKDRPSLKDNLHFYNGKIKSHPDGDFIYNIHKSWFGNYKRLERHHGYIQWLFPIREDGMNWKAQALQLHEAKAIQSSKEMSRRVLTSFRLMLDFYGMRLEDPDTGLIERSDNWKACFDNLQWSSHNYLRITRILKSLGELGYEHLKKPFLEFVLHEALVERTLERVLRSCQDYWIGTVKNDKDRELLHKRIEEGKKK